ncbi:hypothetical protein, partial [uncultured Gammaproteobacteria bacterium]
KSKTLTIVVQQSKCPMMRISYN